MIIGTVKQNMILDRMLLLGTSDRVQQRIENVGNN
jgi:hypothetical protein